MNYTTLASRDVIEKVVTSLKGKNYDVYIIKDRAEALEKIKSLIPKGASVMNGSSATLEQIGYIDLLKSGMHGWNNLHEGIVKEKDPEKQAMLRKQGVLSDYYLGSVHALIENGEWIIASNTGSQMPHIVYTSPHLIFVVSTKKIVPTFADGMKRLEEHVVPLENESSKKKYGSGTSLNKIVIFKNENPRSGRKIHMILVEEDLGF